MEDLREDVIVEPIEEVAKSGFGKKLGVAGAVVAVVVTGVMLYKRHKKKKAEAADLNVVYECDDYIHESEEK